MRVEQIDLFEAQRPAPALNGFYYEANSRKFVSFVLGRRHFEIRASRCTFPAEWKQKIMKERVL